MVLIKFLLFAPITPKLLLYQLFSTIWMILNLMMTFAPFRFLLVVFCFLPKLLDLIYKPARVYYFAGLHILHYLFGSQTYGIALVTETKYTSSNMHTDAGHDRDSDRHTR